MWTSLGVADEMVRFAWPMLISATHTAGFEVAFEPLGQMV